MIKGIVIIQKRVMDLIKRTEALEAAVFPPPKQVEEKPKKRAPRGRKTR